MSSREPGARERPPPGSPYLFSEIPLEGPLEELERVHRRRRETARTLGEDERGARLDEAYALARACLQSVLDEAHAPGSSLVQDSEVAAVVTGGKEANRGAGPSGGATRSRDPASPPASPPPEAADGSS